MADARVLEVIDLAYQAVMDSALWAPTLEAAADVIGGSAAAVAWRNPTLGAGGVAVRTDPNAVLQHFDRYAAIDPIQIGFDRMRESDRVARPVFTDRACVDRGELLTSEYFNDFMRRHDLGSAMMMSGVAFIHDGAAPSFNVYRPLGAEEFDAAEVATGVLLQRPLQRAFQMSQRLARQRRLNEGLGEYVAQLAGAVFAVEGDGRIAYANPAGEAMLALRDGLFSDRQRLRASSGDTQRRLALLLVAGIATEPDRRRGGSLAAPRPSGRRSFALLATPAPRASNGKPLVLLSVVDPELVEAAPEARLRDYFGFTPAEARVASEMISGYGAREISDRLGRSVHTVRVQIRRVLDKTGTSRQSETVAMMLRTLGASRRSV